MKILFSLIAALLLFLYAPYFVYILSGRATVFEGNIQEEMLKFLPQLKYGARRNLYLLCFLLILCEVAYFVAAWSAVQNDAYQWLTIEFAIFEVYHLLRVIYYFRLYLKDKASPKRIVWWPMERVVSMIFVAHAIIGAALLILP